MAPRAEEDANQPPVAMDEGAGPEAVAAPDEPSRAALVGDGEGREAEQEDGLLGAVGGSSKSDKAVSGETEMEDRQWIRMLRDENGKEETNGETVHRSKGELELSTDSVAEVVNGEPELVGNLVSQLVQLEKTTVELPIFKSKIETLGGTTVSESEMLDDREPVLPVHREPDEQDDKTLEPTEQFGIVIDPRQYETIWEPAPPEQYQGTWVPAQPYNRDREPEQQNSTAGQPEHLEETAREQPDNREPAQPDDTAREPEQPLPAFVEAVAPAEANNVPAGGDAADQGPAPPVPPRPNRPLQGLGDAHQAMMQGGGPTGFQPYTRPDLFPLRVSSGFWH